MIKFFNFIRHIVFFNVNNKELHLEQKLSNMAAFAHDCYLELLEEKAKNNEQAPQAPIHTGVDYENYIESLLQAGKFNVSRTPTTGDQGVDLVAEKNGIRIAVQCKYYSKPVGNKAVQEVIAGRDFYNCQVACVVSNNSFTSSARKIANVAKVLLLNESNIAATLDDVVNHK